MKTTRIRSLAMTMAMGMIASLQASVTEHQPPAPLPEFKTPEQLAKWRAEQSQKTQVAASSQESGVFYTGKPYLAESGSYAFKYREYSPEMNRWTTIDPSGFPDGANNRLFAAVSTIELDADGCAVQEVLSGDMARVQTAIEGFKSAGWNYAVRRAEASLNMGGDETAPQNEINSLYNAQVFNSKISKQYFQDIFIEKGKKGFEYNSTYPVINYGVSSGIPYNDLGAAYGNLGGSAKGVFSAENIGSKIFWSIDVTFNFSDIYDFGGSDPFSSAFRRLQENGLASIYTTKGTFTKNYSGFVE